MSVTSWTISILEGDTMDHDITLADVLAFCTGYDKVPLNGWTLSPKILFDHEKAEYQKGYFYVSTCTLELTLPTTHTTYANFKSALLQCVKLTTHFDAY